MFKPHPKSRWRWLRGRRQLGGQQAGSFEQAAEILLARVLVRPGFELEIRGGLITHFQSSQMHNPDIFRAALPDLSLLKFHDLKTISLDPRLKRDARDRLLFLAGGLLADYRGAFLCGHAAALGCLLAAFLLVRFRGFVSHNIFAFSFCGLLACGMKSFPADLSIMPPRMMIVNTGYNRWPVFTLA